MSQAIPPKYPRDLSKRHANAQLVSPMSIHQPPYTFPSFGERIAQGNLRKEEEYRARAANEIAEFGKKFNGGK